MILATYAGTCAVTWHAHFYLLMPLIPLLAYLDGRRLLPSGVLAAWLLAPPLVYLLVYQLIPSAGAQWVRNGDAGPGFAAAGLGDCDVEKVGSVGLGS